MRTLLTTLALMPALAWAQADVPPKLGLQGLLLKADGSPEAGVASITFALFDADKGGADRWKETQQVALTDGFYAVFLGDAAALPPGLFSGEERFLEVSVGGTALAPRQRIASVAYALKAGKATVARDVQGGGFVDALSILIGGKEVIDVSGKLVGNAAYSAGEGLVLNANSFSLRACTEGQVLKRSGTDWVCAADIGGGAGGVTAVTATAPVLSSVGTTPNISIPKATTTTNGYLAAADWTAFDGKAPGSGSPNYIQNQTAASQAASYDISGTARVGGTTSLIGNVGVGTAAGAAALSVASGAIRRINVNSNETILDYEGTVGPGRIAAGVGGPSLEGGTSVTVGNLSGTVAAQFSTGSASAPALTLKPVVGQVGLEVQGGAQTSAVFPNRVGIGTSTPAAQLEVNGALRVGNGASNLSNVQHGKILNPAATGSQTFPVPYASGTLPTVILTPARIGAVSGCNTIFLTNLTETLFSWHSQNGITDESCGAISWIAIGGP